MIDPRRETEEFVVPTDLSEAAGPPAVSIEERERTFWLGLGMLSGGFLAAEGLHSLVWAPLALVVPGLVLTVLGVLALIGAMDR